MRNRLVLVCAAMVAVWAGAAAGGSGPAPRETGKTETVEVHLVTVDVVVLDEDDRTVPDLGVADFRLVVDGRPVGIDTLDASCPGGALAEPRPGRAPGGWAGGEAEATARSGAPRRIVFALDYLHLPYLPCPDMTPGPCMMHTRVLRQLRRTVPAAMGPGDEAMIVALTGGLRVEQPFSDDPDRIVATLERMEHDVTLWAGNFEHATERPLFRGLEALADVLGALPGPKAVVLFSGGDGPGLAYDLDFRALAARAAAARMSLYTVDCLGLYALKPFT